MVKDHLKSQASFLIILNPQILLITLRGYQIPKTWSVIDAMEPKRNKRKYKYLNSEAKRKKGKP